MCRLLALVVLCAPVVVFAEPSKYDFLKAAQDYGYSSITLNKVAEVGCGQYLTGFPVGYNLSSVRQEIIANTPDAARSKVNSIIANPDAENTIYGQLIWMDLYKSKKSAKQFQGMCLDFGGQQLAEWRQYRKVFFQLAAQFK